MKIGKYVIIKSKEYERREAEEKRLKDELKDEIEKERKRHDKEEKRLKFEFETEYSEKTKQVLIMLDDYKRMIMNHTKFKKCPACGGVCFVKRNGPFSEKSFYVTCVDCGLMSKSHESYSDAVKEWNDWDEPQGEDGMKSKDERIENDMLDTMWAFLQMGGMKSNYPALKEACMELRQMLMQKTAGQRKDSPNDISFDNLPRVKNTIIIEAMALVFSGELETEKVNQDDEQ